MSDLRPVLYHFKREHAGKLRHAANHLASALDTQCIEVALYLHNLADKIDEAFKVSGRPTVVQFRPRGDSPGAA